MIRAQVIVRPRASIFDPQGDAVQRAVRQLGLTSVKQAHVGKFIELELDTKDAAGARARLETICHDLLSNPVIEDYVLTFAGGNEHGNPRPPAAKLAAKKAVKPKKAVKKAPAKAAKKKPVAKAKLKTKPKLKAGKAKPAVKARKGRKK
jgi:phosphoribosylformylglycinamidine synthase